MPHTTQASVQRSTTLTHTALLKQADYLTRTKLLRRPWTESSRPMSSDLAPVSKVHTHGKTNHDNDCWDRTV